MPVRIKNQQRETKKKRAMRGGSGERNSLVSRAPQGVVLMRGPGRILPSRVVLRTGWSNIYANTSFSAGSYELYQYRINSPYDPDYTLGIGDLSDFGWTELSALYKFYRVLKTTIELELSGIAARSYVFTAFPSNDVSVSAADVQLWPQWPYSRSKVVGLGTGKGRETLRIKLDPAVFTGARNYRTDDNYASSVASNPSNVVYLNVGIVNINSATAASAGDLCWKIDMVHDVELWEQQDNFSELCKKPSQLKDDSIRLRCKKTFFRTPRCRELERCAHCEMSLRRGFVERFTETGLDLLSPPSAPPGFKLIPVGIGSN